MAAPSRQGEGRGDLYAYTSDGVRPSGLTGSSAGLSTWAGYPVLIIFGCSVAGLYTLLLFVLVFTAIGTKDKGRRKTTLKILKIIAGPIISIGSTSGGGS